MPETAGGLFTSGGSAATLNAMVAARHAAGNGDRLVLYESDQCHASVHRAARICGFRADNLRHVPTDDHYRLDVEALAQMVRRDRSEGRTPFMVSANAGATNTGAIDPLAAIADLCEREGLWSTSTRPTAASPSSTRPGAGASRGSSGPTAWFWIRTSGSSSPMRRAA